MKARQPSIAKITCPGAQGIVQRKRLFRLLDKRRNYPVLWVSGPAGAGKTALVASYVGARKIPCLWYRIDEGDADLATFFYYMGMAVKKTVPWKRNALPLLTPEYLAGIPTFTRRFFEELYRRLTSARLPSRMGKEEFALVFDNYQDVPVDSPFHEMIRNGLEAMPESVNVLVLSRGQPPTALTCLYATNKIGLIGWDEIRFTVEETREILRMKGEKKLPRETLLRLHKRTEGWAAGLILMIAGSRIRNMDYKAMKEFPTKEVYDYFAAEIFKNVEGAVQDFLLRTALLPRMTVPIAEKLTGVTRAGETLSALAENHYFIEKYSEEDPTYQYHPLFRDFLLSEAERSLGKKEISLLQCSAARLLVEHGRIEDAAELFRKGKDWDGLIRLICDHGRSLITQGRSKTLQEWMMSIPGQVSDQTPWLPYWLAVCHQPFNPSESRRFFEQAFHGFQRAENPEGSFLAWSGAVDTILFEGDDFSSLDRWIEWLDKRIERSLTFPSVEIEARVVSSLTGALVWRQPYHANIKKWIERSLVLSEQTSDINLRLQACLYAVNYYAWVGDLAHCSLVGQEIKKMAKMPSASSLMLVTWKWMEALMHNRTRPSSGQSLKSISEGLEIANIKGVHVWDHMLFAQGVYASLNRKDMEMAEDFLKKMEAILEGSRRHGLCQYHHLAAWHHLLTGSLSDAVLSAEKALGLAEETGAYFTRILCGLGMAQVLHEKGEFDKAMAQLAHTRNLVRRSGSTMLDYMCLLKEAQFDLDQGNEAAGLQLLREAMTLGRKHEYIHMFHWWQPSSMAKLCAKALAMGIEVDYVRGLIREGNLFPEEPPWEIEDWPWPLKVYTLGRFELARDGKPTGFSGKVQKKPLLLLKALIALGGKEVREERLSDMLWPEANGDQAYNAFRTTLLRLRQLIGNDKTMAYHEGRVTIDPRSCWVDAWAFERVYEQVETELMRIGKAAGKRPEKDREIMALMEKGIKIYQGHFLADETEVFWTTSYRERLRRKYLLLTTRLGDWLGQAEEWEKAAEYYHKGLEVDDLAEEFYQHLMVCYRNLGQPAKAIEVYRRCRKTLSTVLGIGPSSKTEAIFENLKRNVNLEDR
ncbi:MAG TPA: BTAD domain-containing putative transcriptional regulator [Thermodesulfobacteriota bacterium]|nr:BTAD domain-containing putative transcriptional regulator [Thermodesulfobacteriota bacterium]